MFYAGVVALTVMLAAGFGFWFIRSQRLTGNDFLLAAESKEILARIADIFERFLQRTPRAEPDWPQWIHRGIFGAAGPSNTVENSYL